MTRISQENGDGCTPMAISAFLTFTRPGRFIFNNFKVARPSGVKPDWDVKSSLQAKCMDHSSLRGLKRGTFCPDSGSGHSMYVHFRELHPSHAKAKFSSSSLPFFLQRNDVLNMKGVVRKIERELAIFATSSGPFLDKGAFKLGKFTPTHLTLYPF